MLLLPSWAWPFDAVLDLDKALADPIWVFKIRLLNIL